MAFEIDPSYKEVADRLADLKEIHPDARLRPVNEDQPFTVIEIGELTFIVYAAACYRDADDKLPAIGVAWEPFPGTTPYTRNSELMNAETSAWGRAIIACLRSESKHIASAEEVRNRQGEQELVKPVPTVRREPPKRPAPLSNARKALATTPDPTKISEKQIKLVAVLFGKKDFPDDREVRHHYAEAVLGHAIASVKDLTKKEASTLIDALNAGDEPQTQPVYAAGEEPFEEEGF
jgi:hypothetical protein